MPPFDSKPPIAARDPVVVTLHGTPRSDDYAWLKDPDWQRVMREPEALDARIRAHLEAENAHTDTFFAPREVLTKTLVAEMRGRMKEDDSSVPAPDGAWAYYRRYVEGGEHPLYCRVPRDGTAEELLLDGNREAEGQAYLEIGDCEHSHDHNRLAYTLDLNGSERYRLFVRDIASGDVIDGPIEDAYGDVIWAADGETVFYTVIDENHRPCQVRRHRIGSDPKTDPVVYEESDPGFFVRLGESESKRFVMISAHNHTTSEVYLIESASPESTPRLVAAREPGIEYDIALRGDRLYILTNADGAIDFKVVTAELGSSGREAWCEWLLHEPGTYVLEQLLFACHHVRLERVGGLPRIVITDLEIGEAHTVAFEEEAYDLALVPGYESDTEMLRFVYSSMTTPQQTFDYDMRSRVRILRKTQEVPSGHDPADYVTRRLTAVSHDGAEVPVSLLHRRETPLDGTAPLLLYSYGAYGHAIPAAFSTNRLSLVDRGFAYAIAHIRGGSDCGFGWYLDGKLAKKTNTFADFIAAAEHLIAEGYTAKGRIAAHGGSAGGMLMGAVANLRPDLFASVVAEVPFVDVLNTMCDEDLPLTPPEWPEWGNPIEDEDAYRTIAAYAPYENVTAQDYPAIFATAGLMDPRVTYWEPAKWVAKLRRLKTDNNPVLLLTNMEAGHGGASGRFRRLKEVAMAYTFVLAVSGRKCEDSAEPV